MAAAHSYSIAPAYTFARSSRYRDPSKSPGPFDYSPAKSFYNPCYSLSRSKRILSNYRNITPGPGYYNYGGGTSTSRYSISKAPSRAIFSKTPGPGTYEPNRSYSHYKSPRFSFNGDSKFPKIKNNVPPPGAYEIPSTFKGPKFSLSKAKKDALIKPLPGPGYYEIPSTIGVASLRGRLRNN